MEGNKEINCAVSKKRNGVVERNKILNADFLKNSDIPGLEDHMNIGFADSSSTLVVSNQQMKALSSSKSSLRSCKSYSDIHLLSEKCKNIFPYTPQKDLSLKDDSVFPALDVSCDKPVCLPDPYYELPEESRHFVDAVTGMGFSRGQVARTVKHLGADEKTVIEHLCQIQHLEDCGYDSLEAEAALHLHDYNQDQAKQFLDLINKFQDLGFEKNAVKKALIQNKNDESKTIDALLS